jgi:predicted regulator of Ras-like GTPase activity (Roadblock/LC7/MglB family)
VPAAQPLSREEIEKALNDLNTWSEDDLHHHNLGPTLTQRILEFRAQKGGFKDLRELLQITGIGPKLFQRVLGFSPESLDDQAHAINRWLGVPEDHEMTLQEIVKCTSQLPGVDGCIVAMSDGLYMTGELPKRFDSERVSAFAPQLFARVAQYVQELNVGEARRFTIFTDAQPITIFKSGDLFFILIHKANRFSKVLLNKCERISQEISKLCSKENAKG